MTIAVIISLLLTAATSEQPTIPPELLAAAAERSKALAQSSAKGFGEVVTDDFLHVSSDGRIQTKFERMKSVADADGASDLETSVTVWAQGLPFGCPCASPAAGQSLGDRFCSSRTDLIACLADAPASEIQIGTLDERLSRKVVFPAPARSPEPAAQ